jgi:hypothetical protein
MANSIPTGCRKFRAAVIPQSVFMFVGSMLIVLTLIVMRDGFHFDRRALAALAIATGALLVLSILDSWILSLAFTAAFSSEGIYGHSVWGWRRFVRWQDISSVRTFRLANLRWLRVFAADGKVTWVALFQSKNADFREEIRRLAPPGHAVLNHI